MTLRRQGYGGQGLGASRALVLFGRQIGQTTPTRNIVFLLGVISDRILMFPYAKEKDN